MSKNIYKKVNMEGGLPKHFTNVFRRGIKKWIMGAAILIAIPLVAACHANSSTVKSTVNENKISFVKQAKSKGTYVWLRVGSDEGISKDAIVNTIYVMKNGKTRTYQIFNPITLGTISKQSAKATIALAKKENKKFATTGAISEIKHVLDWKTTYEGQQDDFQDVSNANFALNYSTHYNDEKIKPSTFKYIPASENTNTNLEDYGSTNFQDLYSENLNKSTDQGYAKAIIQHIQDSKYVAPVAEKIKVANDTDASGNTITSQALTYTLVNFFDDKAIQKNIDAYFVKHPNEAIQLVNAANASASATTDVEDAIKSANDLYIKIISPHYSAFTEGAYSRNKVDFTMHLNSSVSQKIYKKRFIGYTTGSSSDYVLTKAQSEKQEAVLEK